jgi:hypothetical protein
MTGSLGFYNAVRASVCARTRVRGEGERRCARASVECASVGGVLGRVCVSSLRVLGRLCVLYADSRVREGGLGGRRVRGGETGKAGGVQSMWRAVFDVRGC